MPNSRKQTFDAVVVGSGASGGWAVKRLAEAGLKVALLDAGPLQKDENFTEHMAPYQMKYRDMAREVILKTRPIQGQFYDCSETNYHWYANDLDEPFTTYPGMPFTWGGRLRIGGGRTNVWGRLSLRYSDLDFKAASHDGYGVDWPLSYKDLAPYYDLVERYVGIAGQAEGNPVIPDGAFQPPMAMTCAEVRFRERVKARLGRTVTPGRNANLTQPLNGRAACHYCGPCERGCVTHSYFNSSFTTVPDALKTGNCTYVPNAMAFKVLMDSDRNRATGILYIDRNTREPREIFGRTVLLCAQTYESLRILLNSANRQYPNGLANSSGVLGHYLMDHVAGGGASGEFPDLAARPTINGPNRPCGIYVPRFRNLPNGPRSKHFIRGYGYEGGGGADFNRNAAGFGDDYKQEFRKGLNTVSISMFGEVLGRWDNFADIDPHVKDTYGIPALRFHVTHGENEAAMLQDGVDSAAEMLEAAGAQNIRPEITRYPPGRVRHEVGVARMGTNARASVLNQFQQSHDVKNLFVTDAAGFPSNPCENPTLTIMALCVRSCDHLMAEMKRGNI
ncbi:MAG TPA: GMC family oxidoreductase [Terriglobia bacterium]|nr:GMC family oxidoreductase [Terriglobia bacterium]